MQGGFKVEVFIHFFRSDAHVAARCQAPVFAFDLLTVHQFHKARNIAQLGLWKSFGQPVSLLPEVPHLLELFDRKAPKFIGRLASFHNITGHPGIAVFGVAFGIADLNQSSRQLVDQIGLLDQIIASTSPVSISF